MIEWIAHNLAPIMFATLMLSFLTGFPVAFALIAVGSAFFFIGLELSPFSNDIALSTALLSTLPDRLLSTIKSETLLAIPFFTFMGLLLERSGMAEDLLETVGELFGTLRAGLAYAVLVVGALLAATTGVVAASVISMGLISLPVMLRYGYDRKLAAGIITASGTLAQIIPPSIVLIVLADQLGRSVGDMYRGAIYPALGLVALYALYVLILSALRPGAAPATASQPAGSRLEGAQLVGLLAAAGAFGWVVVHIALAAQAGEIVYIAFFAMLFLVAIVGVDAALGVGWLLPLPRRVVASLLPPLILIFLVLGSIFVGLATPTEAGALGAVGAVVLAALRKCLSLEAIRGAVEHTSRLTCFVMFILIGAGVFSLTFYGINGHIWVEELLVGLPGGVVGFLIIVNLMVFLLSFFLDFFELAFIIVPLLAPVAELLGIDLIWFGVLLALNMQTSFLHPPFGFALFYLRSVAPKVTYQDSVTGKDIAPVTTGQIYLGAIPFVGIQLTMVALTIFFPDLVLHYDSAGAALSETEAVDTLRSLEIPSFGDDF